MGIFSRDFVGVEWVGGGGGEEEGDWREGRSKKERKENRSGGSNNSTAVPFIKTAILPCTIIPKSPL